MNLEIARKGKTSYLKIENGRIIWPNFSGRAEKYTREGDRHFTLVIPDMEMAEALQNDLNEFGVGWNVRINEPRTPDESPFIKLKVKVKFNQRGPAVFLKPGENGRPIRLNEETIGRLDDVDILTADMDIRAYDDEINGKPFRSAYLDGLYVVQDLNRFEERFAEEEYPEE